MRDQLIEWLNKAYAMEEKIVEVLEKQSSHLDDWPDMLRKVEEHRTVSQRHAELVRSCIENLGESPADVSAKMAEMMGNLEGLMQGVMEDAVVKFAVVNYSTEFLEIGTYTAIRTAAEQLEETSVVDMCDEILAEEQEMASWLEEQLPGTVEKYLSQLSS